MSIPVLASECYEECSLQSSTCLLISLNNRNAVVFFYLTTIFGVKVFKQMEIKQGDFSVEFFFLLEFPPDTFLCFCLLFSVAS